MAIKTTQALLGTSDKGAPRMGRGGIVRLGRPGTLAVALAVVAFILIACGGTSDDTIQNLPSVATGSEEPMEKVLAPNFDITLFQGEAKLGGTDIDVRQFQGKPLIINFWAGLCPPCRAELPDLQEFYNEFSDQVTLVGVDVGVFTGLGSLQDAKDLLEELQISYPVGFTDDGSVIQKYKVFAMPTTIFIDASGENFKKWGGALTTGVLREQTNAMLAQ